MAAKKMLEVLGHWNSITEGGCIAKCILIFIHFVSDTKPAQRVVLHFPVFNVSERLYTLPTDSRKESVTKTFDYEQLQVFHTKV